MFHIRELKEYLNLRNKTKNAHVQKTILSHIINSLHV
jgi:hypothetical protein